jgi:hypothetical protein
MTDCQSGAGSDSHRLAFDLFSVILEIAFLRADECIHVKANVSRAVDQLAIGDELVRRAGARHLDRDVDGLADLYAVQVGDAIDSRQLLSRRAELKRHPAERVAGLKQVNFGRLRRTDARRIRRGRAERHAHGGSGHSARLMQCDDGGGQIFLERRRVAAATCRDQQRQRQNNTEGSFHRGGTLPQF